MAGRTRRCRPCATADMKTGSGVAATRRERDCVSQGRRYSVCGMSAMRLSGETLRTSNDGMRADGQKQSNLLRVCARACGCRRPSLQPRRSEAPRRRWRCLRPWTPSWVVATVAAAATAGAVALFSVVLQRFFFRRGRMRSESRDRSIGQGDGDARVRVGRVGGGSRVSWFWSETSRRRRRRG